MKRSHSIPEELIQIKANQIWKSRLRARIDGTPEGDWLKAQRYLEKHRWKVWLWKSKKTFNKLWQLIKRKIMIFGNRM